MCVDVGVGVGVPLMLTKLSSSNINNDYCLCPPLLLPSFPFLSPSSLSFSSSYS